MSQFALLLSCLTFAACVDALDPSESDPTRFEVVGHLQDAAITEASGLARSSSPDRLWVINDSGFAPKLHAIGLDGSDLGEVTLIGARNVDWEDLTTFSQGGQHWIVVADIGDNAGKRQQCRLYFVREPTLAELESGEVTVDRQLNFVYPDGPRDAESISIDIDRQQILILSKRDIPAILYSLPLYPDSNVRQTAVRLGEIESIPQPTQYEIERAPVDLNWSWQPNAMDFSVDNNTAAILTYDAAYYYSRETGQTWFAALQAQPVRYALGPHSVAESVVFAIDGSEMYATTEKRHAPILKANIIQPDNNHE